jgi:branched-chain amino acid transport system substrate-binding protein
MNRPRRAIAAAAAVIAVTALSACGAAKVGGATAAATEAAGAPIKLGVLTSLTGSASSGFTTVREGVEARLGLQNAEGGVDGHKLTYVMADDQSSGTGAVSAVQELIEQDHVYGILDNSSFFSAAAAATTKADIPVAGVSFDAGPEWFDKSATNIFDAYGYGNYSVLSTTWGQFFKSQGATKVGTVAYGDSPSSALAGLESVQSAKLAGLQEGYVNTEVPFGSTNVGPIIQAIKASGTNALYLPVVPNTAFAIAVGLEQAGVKLKAVVLATGYGGDLLQSKSAVAAANGLDFSTVAQPVELSTAATRQFQSALATYAHVTTVPTFGEYIGWLTAGLFIHGLELSGGDASSAAFISKLRHSTWNAAGMESLTNYSDIKPVAGGLTQGNCIYVAQLHGTTFEPLKGASPICGSEVPGVTIHQ